MSNDKTTIRIFQTHIEIYPYRMHQSPELELRLSKKDKPTHSLIPIGYYKDKMYLFKTKEFIDNKIFGLSENNMNILNNLGEYISLCNSDAQFINSPEIEEYYGKTKGNHSGLTQDEMIIPLIVINRKNNVI